MTKMTGKLGFEKVGRDPEEEPPPALKNRNRKPTNTHTIEITALESLYVVCHCLGGMRFYRTATIR